MNDFLQGMRYLPLGLRQLFQPGLRRWVLLPLLTSLLLCGLLFTLSILALHQYLNDWLSRLPDWLAFLHNVIWVLAMLFTLLALALSFTGIANLVAAPFNSWLAEKVIALHAPQRLPAESPPLLPATLSSLKRELRKIGWILRTFLLLALAFIATWLLAWLPGVNIALGSLVSAFGFVFAAWAMSIEYSDYPLDATQQPFTALREHTRRHRLKTLGLGSACALTAMVPLLNILVMPAAVCAGTLLWLDAQTTGHKA